MILAAFAIGQNFAESAAYQRERQDLMEIIDAKVTAGASDANAVAKVARSDAGVALDKVEDLRTQLAAKGIKVELDGH